VTTARRIHGTLESEHQLSHLDAHTDSKSFKLASASAVRLSRVVLLFGESSCSSKAVLSIL
jgi:hypothetical protein